MALKFGSTSSHRVGTSRAFKGSRPRPCVSRPAVARNSRQALVVRAGLFDFLTPKVATATVNPRAEEISEELIDICSRTAVGSKATPAIKEQIEELVSELAQYSAKNPLRSPQLWGTWEVLYCSKPTAVGGPLKKGAGPVVAAGQVARQILEEPDTLINEVTFKTFGFIPGVSKQYGQIRPVSGDTFVLTIREGELNAGIVNQQKEFDITRKIQILYLDDTLRVARFLPSEDLADQESEEAQGGPESEEILFVFQRVAEEAQADEDEEEPEPEEERSGSPVLNLFGGGTRRVESLATQVERQVESQRTRKGTQAFFIGGRGREEQEEEQEDPRAAKQRERAEAQARKQREQEERRAAADRARQEAASAKAAEQARLQKEKEAAAKAKAAQEARERAEVEKAERAARAAAIREQLAELAEELKEKQAVAREAQKDAREVARENQSVLKQVQAAEKAVAEAEQEVQQVSNALDEAVNARKAAEAAVKQAQQTVREAEAAYKQKVAAR